MFHKTVFLGIATIFLATGITVSGWDFNLTKRCIRSPFPGQANYYEDATQCDNWTVAVEAEKALGVSCSGFTNQSLPINTPSSPVSLGWTPHLDEWGRANWKVELTTDLITKTHPCGAGVWTWFVLMDHVSLHGGPFVRPDVLATSVRVELHQNNNQNVTTRSFLGFQGFWDGKSHSIEIDFQQDATWGDADPAPDIIWSMPSNPVQEFVIMNGSIWGLTVNPDEEKLLYVQWINIINSLISRGYLTAPSGGWQKAATVAVYVGTEVNNFTATNAGKTTLYISNLRIVGV